jgi:heptosyltransferase II
VNRGDKILIVGPSWVGDMVIAQSLYRLLVQRRNAEIHVVAPSWSLPVLARMPEVARGIELAAAHGELALAERYALGRQLRAERYAQAIVLPRSAKAALVPWFARVPRRTGFRGEWRYGLLNDIRRSDPALDQTVKRFVVLGHERRDSDGPLEIPRPRLTMDRMNRDRLWRELALPNDRPTIALAPGAEYGPAKRWPIEHFAELAARLAADGVVVIVLGSAKERELGERIRAVAGESSVRNLCGTTSLADAVDLLASVPIVITNDSGLLHVAAATDAHVVALYGSSTPNYTPPLTAANTIFYTGIECSPCFERVCPLGHLKCLREITVATVLDAVRRVLRSEHAAVKESLPREG